ncbi:hypothetical protein SAMN05216167_13440 [Spirosoma endophyticum]|uniref:Uncharacterized protein n=1 Tax=Spirosoma endophyticum TaxID=662367 RepID=A0A1I2GPT6_9BACT|nr:hypothetical protein SAMN05216167_13440 [Spirosoma endophyticum]
MPSKIAEAKADTRPLQPNLLHNINRLRFDRASIDQLMDTRPIRLNALHDASSLQPRQATNTEETYF